MKRFVLVLAILLLSFPALASSTLYSNDAIGEVGIGTNTPDALLSLNGQSAQTIDVIRETTASTAGNNLTIQAGGAIVGGTNLNGGTLNLTSGISTGTGSSGIDFNVYNAGSSGSSDNSPTTVATLTGAGFNLATGVYLVNGTQIAASNLLNGVTGSGNIVLAISPTLTTPNIGAATGTSLSVTGNITTSGGQIGVGTTAPTAGAALDLSYNTNSMLLPVGTTGQEPANPVNGMIRYDSTLNAIVGYINGAWTALSAGFSSCTQVTSTCSSCSSPITATCSAGYTLTGGGCQITVNGQPTPNPVTLSYPSASNAWTCAYANTATSTFTAYAMCCH